MKNRPTPFLSKTKYLDGLKCHKLLWYEYNRKEDLPEVDAAATLKSAADKIKIFLKPKTRDTFL